MYLSDVPTVDVNSAFLAPPPPTSVTDLSYQQPGAFVVKLPASSKPTLSPLEMAAIGAAALVLLLSRRR